MAGNLNSRLSYLITTVAKIFELYNCETFRARRRRQQFHNMNWGQERNLVAVV